MLFSEKIWLFLFSCSFSEFLYTILNLMRRTITDIVL
uniref:Uncharacterized protein n=1 Tax=Lepeophtheirus salmonis TaxID=72036 RepID=A0A0K2U805_LEPSM